MQNELNNGSKSHIGKNAGSTVRTVVIAAALGYGINYFQIFLLTLRKKAKYNGDVVLFVEKSLAKEIAMFCDEMKVIRKPVPSGSHKGIRGGRFVGYEQVCKEYDWCFATDFRDVYFYSIQPTMHSCIFVKPSPFFALGQVALDAADCQPCVHGTKAVV